MVSDAKVIDQTTNMGHFNTYSLIKKIAHVARTGERALARISGPGGLDATPPRSRPVGPVDGPFPVRASATHGVDQKTAH